MSQRDWDLHYINIAQVWADKSKDRSTGVGAVIVGPNHEQRSAGYNGFPRGVVDNIDARHQRPVKYQFTEHAERNAIFNAARVGTPTEGCTLYLNWEPCPCPDCTRAVIQAGITQVVGPDTPFPASQGAGAVDWHEGFKISRVMMEEAGIKARTVIMNSEKLPQHEFDCEWISPEGLCENPMPGVLCFSDKICLPAKGLHRDRCLGREPRK